IQSLNPELTKPSIEKTNSAGVNKSEKYGCFKIIRNLDEPDAAIVVKYPRNFDDFGIQIAGRQPKSLKAQEEAHKSSWFLSEEMSIISPRSATVCVFCEKSFQNNGQLRRHLLIHTGERPYRCNNCNYSANQAVHLKTHCLRVHPGDPEAYHKDDSDDETGIDLSLLFETPKEVSLSMTDIPSNAKTPKQLSSDTIGPKVLFRAGQTPLEDPVESSKQEVASVLREERTRGGNVSAVMGNPKGSTKQSKVSKTNKRKKNVGAVSQSDAQVRSVGEVKPVVDSKTDGGETEEGLMQSPEEVLNFLAEELLLPPKPQLSSAPATPISHSVKRKRGEGDQIVPAKKTRAQSVDNLEEEDPNAENSIHCEECEFTCTYWRSMTAHMKNVHRSNQQEEASMKCLLCDQLFKSSFALKIHKNRVHVTEKPYKCKHCNFSSVSKQYWLRHERFQHAPPSGVVGVKTRKVAEQEVKTSAKPELIDVQDMEEKILQNLEDILVNNNIKENEDTSVNLSNSEHVDETMLVIAE
ncbi:unnamed protein product, partial [Allacma fusca]